MTRTPFLHRVALAATVVFGFCCSTGTFVSAQSIAGINARILLLKRAPFEQTPNAWTLLGPQSTLELEWVLRNTSGEPVELPAPRDALRLRAFVGSREIHVRTVWATDTPFSSVLADGATILLRASAKRTDGSMFRAGDYELRLDVDGLRQSRRMYARDVPYVDAAAPVPVRIVPLDSLQRRREFHLIEGGFYLKSDSNRALREYAALDGRTPADRILAEIERLRKAGARAKVK